MTSSRRSAALLSASESCVDAFVERGNPSLTITELASRAEISERTFYRYFATKEESIRPVLDEGNRELLSSLRDQPTEHGLRPGLAAAFVHTMGESFERRTRALMPIIFGDAALKRVWQAASFETADLIRPEIARLIDEPESAARATVVAGQAVVAIVVALQEVARNQTPAATAIAHALEASSHPHFARIK
ncbi:TetR/AcrR family transcriptional regulator [Saxibacter everestensis]|uniref:TetR/AcrR family transcriptional regulator n=1 Tax=Saxibacter everestensis TaxID=2909229 RepID=A0ABY8QQI5_9MICO|nr:TetR/AcrR family transcriptional regulator [Brevibacteriaceae bacterium ZFBP1038]